ncbi:hypothetical protein Btru_031262 [Bulinus truncatus]|nr:hypothetical protein Btru_031262 [Bulinus truncatus]
MTTNYSKTSDSLPPPGIPALIHEIIATPYDALHVRSVRVVGRIVNYDPVKNLAFLIEPNQSIPSPHQLTVDTSLTDSSDYINGSQVMLIGELEELDNSSHPPNQAINGGVILKARISRCVDRLDYLLYCKTLESLRRFLDHHFKESNLQ